MNTFPKDIPTRNEATELCQTLVDLKVIRHSAGKEKFVDGHYFYEFIKVFYCFLFSIFFLHQPCV